MNRGRRAQPKPFVAGGVYDPSKVTASQSPATTPAKPAQVQQKTPQVQQKPLPQREALQVHQLQHQIQQLQQEQDAQFAQQEQQESLQKQEADENGTMDTDGQDDETSVDGRGKIRFKKIFLTRKKSSVRTKEKRIRQNRQLRKTLIPKNALMALNEVRGINLGEFVVNSDQHGGFSATITVNGKQFEGRGSSKMGAKNNVCEKALRDYVITKMLERPRKAPAAAGDQSEAMETEDTKPDISGDNKDENGDDLPMINLASFAIFKLFTEWERDGYVVPELHPSIAASAAVSAATSGELCPVAPTEPKKVTNRTELPANWEAMHPTTLLCLMRPGLSYTELGTIDENKPQPTQRIGIVVDGKEFFGTGRSKKLARKNTAVNACNTLFGTNFQLEGVEE